MDGAWPARIVCSARPSLRPYGGYPEKTSPAIEHSEPGAALIYFVMRLLRPLQAVGSAPAIDYDAYLRSVPGSAHKGGPR